jgi:MoCo/4Fe-4S cofactor protein with predicted Tat translocation signal
MSKRKAYDFAKREDAGPIFWKSLEDRADPTGATKRAEAEFPFGTDLGKEELAGVRPSRRGFLLGGMTAAMATVAGCARRPVEKIVPYTRMPEYALPGIPYHYATVRHSRGDAIGLVVESHEGRPTKIEGNPEHPASGGSTDIATQGSLLDLYDPDRTSGVKKRGPAGLAKSSIAEFDAWFDGRLKAYEADGGAKLRILAPPTNSRTFMRLREAIRNRFPHAGFHTFTSVSETNARAGARIAFGQAVNTLNDYQHAKVILSLDADFLQTEPGMIRATKLYARGRRLNTPNDAVSRLYVVEPGYSTTGANADHRLRLAARDVERYLAQLATELAAKHGVALGAVGAPLSAMKADGVPAKWVTVVAKELAQAKGRGVIVAGTRQPARVHALVHLLNAALGNVGQTVQYFRVADPDEGDQITELKALLKDLDEKRVETLLVLGGNPAYEVPADLKWNERLGGATVVHLGSHEDETSAKAAWLLPLAHELETWGDQLSLDGSYAIQQPLIAPLHGGVSDIEILGRIAGEGGKGHDLVQGTLRASYTQPFAFDREWKKALQRGVVAGADSRPFGIIPVREADVAKALSEIKAGKALGADNLEIAFQPDPKLFDGRHANNPWLLELPDPMSKIVWDNAAYMSPATAQALGVESGDVVQIARAGAQAVEIAAWVLPGHADNAVTLHLGWGRTHAGRYGGSELERDWNRELDLYPLAQKLPINGRMRGFNVAPLRTSDAMGFADGAKITKTDKKYKLTQTQEHHSMEGRPIAIDATLAEYRQTPSFPQYRTPDPKVLPLWTPVDYTKGHRWGMTIDLNACTGCNACVIACQSENNVAVVGKDQVERGREMHWIRIDRYFRNDYARAKDEHLDEKDPLVAIQPVACVQCEEAPCENVCPVNATEHSPEGLNDMAYNRCIGTRYCANNCPYKVRRFNYLEFEGDPLYGDMPETVQMAQNPNVTVRMRGVMEKCTYCVQRIQEGKIAARRENRPMKDGDVVTACAQACPAEAIVFGDLNDPTARVTRMHKRDRSYRLLSEIGTHPRTTHLAKIRNPNPEMV